MDSMILLDPEGAGRAVVVRGPVREQVAISQPVRPGLVSHVQPMALVHTPPASHAILRDEPARAVALETNKAPHVVVHGFVGPQGLKGPQGDAGSADAFFHFTQSTPSGLWDITHGLGKFPSVTTVNSAGEVVEGTIDYLSPTRLTVSFSAPFSGNAYLN